MIVRFDSPRHALVYSLGIIFFILLGIIRNPILTVVCAACLSLWILGMNTSSQVAIGIYSFIKDYLMRRIKK